jgi:hypothetical protein
MSEPAEPGSESEFLAHDIHTAGDIQKRLIPKEFPSVEGYELAAAYRPCAEISGDYYDVLRIDDSRIGMVVADVSGRGPAAGFIMSQLRGFLHSNLETFGDPRAGLLALNDFLHASIPKGMFVRLTFALLQPSTGQVTMVNCGHTSPMWFRSGAGEVRLFGEDGMALGLSSGAIAGEALRVAKLQLQPGDAFVLCTDGITEAENADGEEFQVRRAAETLKSLGKQGAKACVDGIVRETHAFAGTTDLDDDLTVLAVRRASFDAQTRARVRMLTINEAAEKAGVSPDAVRIAIQEGRLAAQFVEVIKDFMLTEAEASKLAPGRFGGAGAAAQATLAKVLLVSEMSPFADMLLLELDRSKKYEVKSVKPGLSAVEAAKKSPPGAILFEFSRVEPDVAQALSDLRKAVPAAECLVFFDELKVEKRKPELERILELIGVKHTFDSQRGSRAILAVLSAKLGGAAPSGAPPPGAAPSTG